MTNDFRISFSEITERKVSPSARTKHEYGINADSIMVNESISGESLKKNQNNRNNYDDNSLTNRVVKNFDASTCVNNVNACAGGCIQSDDIMHNCQYTEMPHTNCRRRSTTGSMSKEDMLSYILSEQLPLSRSDSSAFSDTENDQRNSISNVILPIDDNEFAVLKPCGNNQEISYEIYSPVNSNSELDAYSHNSIRLPDFPRSSSFGSSRSLFPKSFNPNPRSEATRSNSMRYSTDLLRGFDDSSPCVKNYPNISSSVVQSPINLNLSYECPKNGDSPMKEKMISIFESNGLFIKRDHPLFCQKFSRKVFIGGLPRDITIENIEDQFETFGSLHVDWPNRESENVPPNGFAFLHFEDTVGVCNLFESVGTMKFRNKFTVSSSGVKSKDVEVKFWRMTDCEFISGDKNSINTSYTVFVGALPRITTASELATFMSQRFDKVVYTAIDVDLTYGYPKGAGRVTFASKNGYIEALESHYVEMDLGFAGKKKKIEIKPFMLSDQKCDSCSTYRPGQNANRYCYRCSGFICESCEYSKTCLEGNPHNLISRSCESNFSMYES